MSKSNYLEAAILDHVLGGPDFTRPATVHVALYTTGTLTDASTGTVPGAVEVSGGGYTRLAVTNDNVQFPAASGDPTTKTNGNALFWPQATADWGVVTQWAILDAAADGNILYWGALPVERQREVRDGDQVFIAAGNLTITED